jgi:hypothetical protein
VVLLVTQLCSGYSVLSHEAIVDAAWEKFVRPKLLARFPDATSDQLKEAHAYVYGGCLAADMGYSPFSSRFYSDLVHYVRSGDFIQELLNQAHTLDEYAFALGFLAHYAADKTGHQSINRITPMVYPKLRGKFGPVVTYEDHPADHLKTEFALDVIQVARGQYASNAYHDFIGFELAQDLLDRTFQSVYGIQLKSLFLSEDLAIGTYRYAVGTLVPEMTKIAWESKRKDIQALIPNVQRSQFVYTLPRKAYEKEWGRRYRRPGFGARFLAAIFRLMPTFGPFKVLRFQPVPPAGEKEFLASLNATASIYQQLITVAPTGSLPNINLDTGEPTKANAYKLADSTYASLLDKLAKDHFDHLSISLRRNLLDFFAQQDSSSLSPDTRKHLEELRALKT